MSNLVSIDLITDTTAKKIAAAIETGNQLQAAALAGSSGAAVYDAFYAPNITSENIDNQFISWWAGASTAKTVDSGDSTMRVPTRTELLNRWFDLLKDDKTYGVKFHRFAVSQATDGELIDDSIALGVCSPSTNLVLGTDHFCKQKAFWTIEINYEIAADGETEIKAVDKVDSSFGRDGTAGMVGVAQKTGWCSYSDDGTYITKRYRACRASGYYPLPEGVRPVDNDVRPFVVHAKYMGGLDSNGKPTSATALAPLNYTYSHNSQITEWRKRGANYAGISICDINFRILMFQLKYGKKGNSGTMEGCTSYNLQYAAAVSETGVERILLTATQASNLLVGSSVIIGDKGTGTSTDRGVASMYGICKQKRIKAISEITVDGVAYTAVYIENGGNTFDVVAGTTYISTMPWYSGSCDDVLGVDGSPTSNTSGKEPFIVQGLESQTGAYAVVADIIDNITVDSDANTMTITPNTVRKAANITTSLSANYIPTDKELTIPKPASYAWHYIGDLAHSDKLPEMTLPGLIDNGASSNNGYKSAVYVSPSAGVFEWLAWGDLSDGANCGLACAHLSYSLGVAGWYFAAGACGSAGNRGEWTG